MVKIFLLSVALISSLLAQQPKEINSDDPLIQKVKSLIAPATFAKDRAYIDIIFSPRSDYYNSQGRVDSVKVIQTLKDNGILNLFFKTPREIKISFKTEGVPLFFVKIMSDSLRNLGYYRYVTKESSYNDSKFTWKISLISEYAADPLILSQELRKSNCEIIDVVRENESDWLYLIDMKDAKLDVSTLEDSEEFRLKRSLYSYWLDVSKVDKIEISSSHRNDWYPYIAYYDKSLKLLRVIKIDKKRSNITLNMRENTHYIKISDIYSLKNIKDDLVLKPTAKKVQAPL
ncbi:MAG: hypothetical protein WCY51_02770 [Sulfurimonas sp.]|uniref:hypothetical protein n=1 Tax=Sulfurimonas sp. TaxID=2022749 RepID=UPI0025EDDB9E|nr:hypothetical protein [Sulfurimonas sp.]MCK9454496.1 hypothetical protein [Sulfurimonas sp.]